MCIHEEPSFSVPMGSFCGLKRAKKDRILLLLYAKSVIACLKINFVLVLLCCSVHLCFRRSNGKSSGST